MHSRRSQSVYQLYVCWCFLCLSLHAVLLTTVLGLAFPCPVPSIRAFAQPPIVFVSRQHRTKFLFLKQSCTWTKCINTTSTITDPTLECTHYSSPLVNSLVASYPPVWQIASIVPGDEEATNAYNAIINDPLFPNLLPKGTPEGDFSGVNYTAEDPDCWWA